MRRPDRPSEQVLGSPPDWSDRRSDRVGSDLDGYPAVSALQSNTGHETLPPAAVPPVVTEGRAVRRGRRQLVAIRHALSERDHAILATVAKLRFVTTSQLESLHFSTHTTPDAAARICRRVLKRLHDWRVIEHLERRIGGVRAGSHSYVWRVGTVGDRILRQLDQAPRDRRHEPSLRFLDHTLAASDCIVELAQASRTGQFELLRWRTEPATWRSYLGISGSRLVLKPDLYVVTAAGEYEDHWFIEIDRGTESVGTVLNQCHQYEAYRRTGDAQRTLEVFPFIVWLVPDAARAARITAAIARTGSLDQSHYRVAVQDQIAALVASGGES